MIVTWRAPLLEPYCLMPTELGCSLLVSSWLSILPRTKGSPGLQLPHFSILSPSFPIHSFSGFCFSNTLLRPSVAYKVTLKTSKRIINTVGDKRVCRPCGARSILCCPEVPWSLCCETVSTGFASSENPLDKHSYARLHGSQHQASFFCISFSILIFQPPPATPTIIVLSAFTAPNSKFLPQYFLKMSSGWSQQYTTMRCQFLIS